MIATWMRWLVRDERGSVLVGGLMLVLVMTLVGSGVFYAAVLDNRAALNDGQQTQALYIAQAGLNAAVREITDNDRVHDVDQLSTSSPTTLFTNRLVGGGSFTATAIPTANPSGFMLRSTACVPANCPTTGHTEVTVQKSLTTTVSGGGPARGSNFLLNTFSLTGNGAVVDSYDSTQATCQTDPANCYTNTRCQTVGCAAELHVNGAGASSTTATVTIGSNSTMYDTITDWRGQVGLGNVYGNVKYSSNMGSCPNCNATHVLGGGTITPATTTCPTIDPTNNPDHTTELIPPVNSCYALAGNHYTTCQTINNNKIVVAGATSWSYDQSTGVFSAPSVSTPNFPTGNICGTGGSGSTKILTLAPMTQTEDSTHGSNPGYCFSSFSVSGGARLNPRHLSGPPQDGNVIIYVTGPVSITGNADINNGATGGTSNARLFQLHSSYDTRPPVTNNDPCPPTRIGQASVGVTITGNATWYMLVNAPKTQISSGGSGTNMYGALIGYDFNANQGSFHFDKAFYNGGVITGGGGILSYTWGTWQACKNPSCT